MNLFVFKRTFEKTEFKTTSIQEFIPIKKEDIEWRYEMTEGSWDGDKTHHYKGFVPYVNDVKVDIYEYIQGKTKMFMNCLLADDNSYRLDPSYFHSFNLSKPE